MKGKGKGSGGLSEGLVSKSPLGQKDLRSETSKGQRPVQPKPSRAGSKG
jgi:hypothetical protein